MKTLELKDICGYILHTLFVVDIHGDVLPCWWTTQDKFYFKTNNGGGWYRDFNNCLPILRPMSDLTKEITHRGEKFVPMVELGECANVEVEVADFEFKRDKVVDVLFHNILSGERSSIIIFDKLNEWMFDYRGLISAGLAIDVNTLPENPYEL